MDVIWWITTVFGAIFVNLAASELFAWGPRCSEWITRHAVRGLAPEIRDRMEEEWVAHLQSIPAGLCKIVAAIGFYLATREINLAISSQLAEEERKNREIATEFIKILAFAIRHTAETNEGVLNLCKPGGLGLLLLHPSITLSDRFKIARPETVRFLRMVASRYLEQEGILSLPSTVSPQPAREEWQ